MNQYDTEVVNSDLVERFRIAEKEDAVLVVAIYATNGAPITLARYKDTREAKGALSDLYMALYGEQRSFRMPESTLYAPEHVKRDARTKRRGGS